MLERVGDPLAVEPDLPLARAEPLEILRAGSRGDAGRLPGRRHLPMLRFCQRHAARGREALAQRLETVALGLHGGGVGAEVRARREDPPDVRGAGVVWPDPRLVAGLELLHVAEDLHEERLLWNPDVRAQVAPEPVTQRPPGYPAAVLREVVEGDADLSPVD